ncbi:helix-turn-helix domain-containing protein [Bradyrhizobium sp.]|uniref:helix-turn-helix domain-containing protein n=1 Tax=Bradyrhizobium sp. TaxID=376 RepID=UPI0023A0BA86|nr:helix-turn-helix domain-containing protein [Bradyrhizobium sp.]MDE2376902.1 helix-turn-helix domain-containing protein [Bradyrhizobium sp.]
MLLSTLAPTSALQLTTFTDVDAFRPAELMEDARSIPLDIARFSATRAVVRLPACRIILLKSFARILDTVYRAPGGMIIISMDDDVQASAKGMSLDARYMVAVRGTDDCHFMEPRANLHAMVIFSPDMPDRGWFDRTDRLQASITDRAALMHARCLVRDLLRAAAAEPGLFEQPAVAEDLQEGLLLAVDDLFGMTPSPDGSSAIAGDRPSKLVRRIDDYVASHPTSPIYTASLASEFGVSMRTLGGAVTKVRGMSLHQYIRLKKLWATRSHLLKGGNGATVASCARAQGFHHMGEFAALYRATFNEAPSHTLSRGRHAASRIAP